MNLFSHMIFFVFGVLGLCLGSFLNVILYRINTKNKWYDGRSRCPECDNAIFWRDLIPIISYIFLRGRCRFCNKSISGYYPLIEFFCGLLFILNYYFYSDKNLVVLLFFGLTSVFLFGIAFYDFRYFIIPDSIIIPLIVIVGFVNIFFLGQGSFFGNLWNYLGTAICIGSFFLIQFLMTKGKGLGAGDIRVGVFMGISLGFPYGVYAVMVGYILGACVAVILLYCGKVTLKTKLPLGSYLILGWFLLFFWNGFYEKFISI